MPDIDPAQIHDGWSAIVAVSLLVVVALLVWTKRDSGTTRRTLTKNNGGSHVKDDLDKLLAGQGEIKIEQSRQAGEQAAQGVKIDDLATELGAQGDRIASLERAAEKRHGHRRLFWN